MLTVVLLMGIAGEVCSLGFPTRAAFKLKLSPVA